MRYGFLGKEAICLKFVKESQSFYYVPISARSCMYTHCMYSAIVFLVNKQCIINTGVMHEWGVAEILPDLFQPVPVS